MADNTLCLIDANSLFYRAFFAIKAQLVTSDGQPTNAIYGFVRMVKRIVEEIKPGYIAVCFDVSKVTHRTRKFSDYKINRPSMPQELLSQVPYIKDVVRAYNFSVFESEGYEADDVIASIVHQSGGKFDKIIIISSDKDILQLVDKKVEVYNPYKDEGIVFDEEKVKEKFGVAPKRIKDLISLMGDSSDNIPGARGIGEKTARQLLSQFNDIDDLMANLSKIKKESVRKIIEDNAEMISLSRELAVLRDDVPVEADLKTLKIGPPDTNKLWDIYKRLEFKGMLKDLAQDRFEDEPQNDMKISLEEIDSKQKLTGKLKVCREFSFFIHEDNINFCFGGKTVCQISDDALLKYIFQQKNISAVTFDFKKARHYLSARGIDVQTKVFDVKLAAYLAESLRAKTDLEALIWDCLSVKNISRLDYLGKESYFILDLKRVLYGTIKEKGMLELLEDVEMPLSDILFEMESHGIAIDANLLKKLSGDMDKKLRKLTESIYEIAGCDFNINSPKQISVILFDKLKLPVVKKTKTGASTDEEVLTRLSGEHELARLLLDYRQISKLKNTYVDALPGLADSRGKIHTTFDQTGTETGRLSSREPNLQNIPIKSELGRSIRAAFVPSEGFDSILCADYSQIELRVLAHLSGDEVLIKAFENDLDIHRYTASLMFSVDEKDVTDQMRENAKRVNFGIVYGMSAYGLAKDLDIGPKEAQSFIDEYFLRYPRVKTYLDSQINFVKENGYVSTILGRRRYIPEINNSNNSIRQFAQRKAINAPIQGSAADLIKLAMVKVRRCMDNDGFKSRLISQVHDELVFEVKKIEEKELKTLVGKCMEGAFVMRLPLKAKIKTGSNWLECEK